MDTVGAFEAKTHLARLLERVAKGEQITITRRGKAVAMLVPPQVEARNDAAQVGRDMLAYRDRVKRSLKGSFHELAHEGHRY